MKEFANATKPIYDVNKKGRDKDVSFTRALEISSNVGISSLVYDIYGENTKKEDNLQKICNSIFRIKN